MISKLFKICTWNIQGAIHKELGNKLDDSEVFNTIKENDITCLLETHADSNSNLDVQGYETTSVNKTKIWCCHKHLGGITILVRDEIKKGVKMIRSAALPHDVVWVKLDKIYFRQMCDIFIAFTYISPSNSTYSQRQDHDMFSLLESEVAMYLGKGKVIITGDLNARTATDLDFIANDIDCPIPLPGDYIPDTQLSKRSNPDLTNNSYGKRVIELCKASGLRILNGRTMGDINGKFTRHEYGGSSMVDYCIAHHSILEKIRYFIVNEWLVHISDHSGIKFGIDMFYEQHTECYIVLTPHPITYKWYDESIHVFKQALETPDVQEDLKMLLDNINNRNCHSDIAVSRINYVFKKVADRCLVKRKKNMGKKILKQKWFDKTCHLLKNNVRDLGKLIGARSFDQQIRTKSYETKKLYRKTLKQTKLRFRENIMTKLNSKFNRNPTEYWKLVNELRDISCGNNNVNDKVKPNVWYEYFKKLVGTTEVDYTKDQAMIEKIRSLESEEVSMGNALNNVITKKEIIDVVKGLKSKKSVSLDSISSETIKASLKTMGDVFVSLFNWILKSGSYPKAWSEGLISTLHKKGATTDPNNL